MTQNSTISESKQAKHTPGPWSIHEDAKGRGFEIYGETKNYRREVCRINSQRSGARRGMAVRFHQHTDDPANARLIAAAPEMYDLIERFGRTVTDMFEQMEKGNWADDHGHNVRLNVTMLALKQPVIDAINLRAALSKAGAL